MVEASVLFLPADVFHFRRRGDIADAERDSGAAEAGRRFADQAIEFTRCCLTRPSRPSLSLSGLPSQLSIIDPAAARLIVVSRMSAPLRGN